jgi:sigma-B regulation protein RsbU (phosphoserine phosphatase)
MKDLVIRSFALKLAVAVTLLALTVAGTTLLVFAAFTRQAMLEEMQERLKDVAHNGTVIFREEDRKLLVNFTGRVMNSPNRRIHLVEKIPDGETRESLPTDVSDALMRSEEFQHLVQLLRRIQHSSTERIQPLEWLKQDMGDGKEPPDIYSAYLMVAIPESTDHQVVMFVADSNYQRFDRNKDGVLTDVETGNPVGSLYKSDYEIYGAPFDTGYLSVSSEWYTDQWGTFMTAVVPIIDEDGNTIATLGLDYLAHAQVARLREKIVSVALLVFVLSLVLSTVVGIGLAYYINIPINRLRRGAERIARRDFAGRIEVRSQDEFGLLADTLNSMAVELAEFRAGLELLVDQRTQELSTANLSIKALNDALAKENRVLGMNIDWLRHLQESHGRQLASRKGTVTWDLSVRSSLHPEFGGDWTSIDTYDGSDLMVSMGTVPGLGVESVTASFIMRCISDLMLAQKASPSSLCDALARHMDAGLKDAHPWLHISAIGLHARDAGLVDVDGHGEDLLVARGQGNVELVDTTQWRMPFGLASSREDGATDPRGLTLRLQPGQSIVLYTSGLVHVRNPEGEPWGYDRLKKTVEMAADGSANELAGAIEGALMVHGGAMSPASWTFLVLRRA